MSSTIREQPLTHESGRVYLHVELERCIGCESCEAVCGYLYGAPRIQMGTTAEGELIPIACEHCDEAHCLRACPEHAIHRAPSGAVILQPELCHGCMACLNACPKAAISVPSLKAKPLDKCDLCEKRRAEGLQPACHVICPCAAILVGTKEQIEAELRKQADETDKMGKTVKTGG